MLYSPEHGGETMASDSKEEAYAHAVRSGKQVPKALGLGLVSAASAIAGGMAVAWWYRKTLTKLQNPIVSDEILLSEPSRDEEVF
jgi:homoserine kinase